MTGDGDNIRNRDAMAVYIDRTRAATWSTHTINNVPQYHYGDFPISGDLHGTFPMDEIHLSDTELDRIATKLKEKEPDVIVHCPACNGWAAVKTMCVHCGYPVG